MIAPCAHTHAFKSAAQDPAALRGDGAAVVHHIRRDVGVVPDAGSGKAGLLDLSGGVHPLFDLGGGFGFLAGGKVCKLHRRHVDVQIQPV